MEAFLNIIGIFSFIFIIFILVIFLILVIYYYKNVNDFCKHDYQVIDSKSGFLGSIELKCKCQKCGVIRCFKQS